VNEINILDPLSWASFSACSKILTAPTVPTQRVKLVYTSTVTPPKLGSFKASLQTAISTLYSNKDKYEQNLIAISKLNEAYNAFVIASKTNPVLKVRVSQLNIIARTYSQCGTVDATKLREEVVSLERELVALVKAQLNHELHDSYWQDYDRTSEYAALKLNEAKAFEVKDESQMSKLNVRGRELLPSYKGDDMIVVNEGRLGQWDGPNRITLCETNGVLTGFQVFYGPSVKTAGSAHGILDSNCKNEPINGEIIEVNLFGMDPEKKSTTGYQVIQGMSIVVQPFNDVQYPGKTITAGLVNVIGQRRTSAQFLMTGKHFFGFKTESANGVITGVKVITFHAGELFNTGFTYKGVENNRATVTSYISARKKNVEDLLENDLLMQLPKAVVSITEKQSTPQELQKIVLPYNQREVVFTQEINVIRVNKDLIPTIAVSAGVPAALASFIWMIISISLACRNPKKNAPVVQRVQTFQLNQSTVSFDSHTQGGK